MHISPKWMRKQESIGCRAGSSVIFTDISDEDVFQKDLEAEFQMARSTASGILQSMEKKQLIIRESIPRDARLKRLVLTPKGMEFQMEIIDNFARIQKALSADIPEKKLEEFYETADMIRENVVKACQEAGEITEPKKSD